MKVYSPSDIAKLLDIKPATLRKYSILLENHGYNIERNSQGHRYYRDKDIITLRNIIRGSKSGVTLEESIINVVKLEGNNSVPDATNNGSASNNNDIAELKSLILKQHELHQEEKKEFKQEIEELKEYIKQALHERDKNLMNQFNERLEAQKQIASAKEKGFWSKLFGK